MLKKKVEKGINSGFTLIELLIVIAIIGILSGIVVVSSSGAVEKSKRASALTTVSSILTELVTCQDDGGFAKATTPNAGEPVCCVSNTCAAILSGHTVTWPTVAAKTGYDYNGTPTGTLATADYSFSVGKTGQPDIVCSYAGNSCN